MTFWPVLLGLPYLSYHGSSCALIIGFEPISLLFQPVPCMRVLKLSIGLLEVYE